MAQDEKDPETRGSGASGAADIDRPSVEPSESVGAQPAQQATPAPMEAAAAPPRRKNRLIMTSAVAVLGLAATAGSIAAYRFRDKHEKLAAFAALVDDYSARPEKLVASLRETSMKWLGDAARPTKKTPSPAPEPRPPLHAESKPAVESKPVARAEAPAEIKPAEIKPPESKPADAGERITWSAPTPIDAPTPPPRPVLETAPATAHAHEPPPVAAALPEQDSEARAEIDALTKRLGELEQIARSALDLAEQTRAAGANAPIPAPSAPAGNVATPEFRDLSDNVSGLEGRIDELGDELKALRERLDSPKDESRLPKEAMIEPPQKPAEDEPNPAAVVVIAHSLQKALERGAPFSTELTALAAQGADKDALERLAPSAETGAPTPHALKTAFHPLVKRMETAAEPHAEESLSERLIHGASKLVKMRAPGEATRIEIAEIGTKIEAALGHEDIGAALAAFADLPEDARALAREWEESARRRLEADSAAATILSSAIAALGKKGKS